MAQLVAHLVRDQEVAGSSPVIQTTVSEALAVTQVLFLFEPVAFLSQFQHSDTSDYVGKKDVKNVFRNGVACVEELRDGF